MEPTGLVTAARDKTLSAAALGRVLLAALAAFRFCAVPGAATARADIVYDQPSVFPALCPCWTSDVDPDSNGWRAWDNFTLSQPTPVSGVNWQGFYFDFITRENNPVTTDTVSWEISFWSNVDGKPGAPIQSQTIPVADVTTTSVASGTHSGDAVPVYDFHANLTPFLAETGTTYWLSILSNSTTFNPIWSWMHGTGGDDITIQVALTTIDEARGSMTDAAADGIVIQDVFPVDALIVQPGDRAFSLEGQLYSPGFSGDFNSDGIVDAADYVAWRNMSGQAGAGLAADGNGDGVVNAADYDLWRAHFGQTVAGNSVATAGPASSGRAAVPEPGARVLILCGMTAAICLRPSRRHKRRDPRHAIKVGIVAGQVHQAAMLHHRHQQGRTDEARQWHEKASNWFEKHTTDFEYVYTLHEEADSLLAQEPHAKTPWNRRKQRQQRLD